MVRALGADVGVTARVVERPTRDPIHPARTEALDRGKGQDRSLADLEDELAGDLVEDPLTLDQPDAEAELSIEDRLKSDLQSYRDKLEVPEKHTVAVGRTDIPALQSDKPFTGASPEVRREASLPSLDEEMPSRDIQSPEDLPAQGRNHAEEGVLNQFNERFKAAGLDPNTKGTLFVYQSNPAGVCGNCIQGIRNPDKNAGVFKQLSDRYPHLTIEVSSATDPTVGRLPGHLTSFTLRGGRFV